MPVESLLLWTWSSFAVIYSEGRDEGGAANLISQALDYLDNPPPPPAHGHLVWIKLLQRVGTYKQASNINLIVMLKSELKLLLLFRR